MSNTRLDADDSILEKEIAVKMTIRQALQMAVIAYDHRNDDNQCAALYQRITERLQTLPSKTLERFVNFTDKLFDQIGPEWPDDLED